MVDSSIPTGPGQMLLAAFTCGVVHAEIHRDPASSSTGTLFFLVVLLAVPSTVICPAFCRTVQGLRGVRCILPEERHRHQAQAKLISGSDPQTSLRRAVFHHFDSQSVSKAKRNSTSSVTALHYPRCSQQ